MLQGQNQTEHEIEQSGLPTEDHQGGDIGPVFLCATEWTAAFERLLGPLEALGMRRSGDLETLEQHLRNASGTRAVVVFPNPVVKVAEKLTAGEDLPGAIASWCSDAEALLACIRRNRRETSLVDGHAALGAPGLLGHLLVARLSWPAIQLDPDSFPASPRRGGPAHLLAAHALRQDETAAMLLSELEASSLALGPAFEIEADAILGKEPAGPSVDEFEKLNRENELLMLQRQALQEELEASFAENQRLRDVSVAAEQAAREAADRAEDKARQAAESAETIAGEFREARENWRRELGEISAELETTGNARVQLAKESAENQLAEAHEVWRQERKALREKAEWSQKDFEAMRRSLSWKLTAPLRRVFGLFTGGSRL